MAWPVIAAVAASALSSYLASRSQSEAAEMSAEATKTGGKYAYPGQKSIAKALTPYLWENLNVGLTDQEKSLYRGEARTSVLQAIKGSERNISQTAAAQGLKGGSIANILSQSEASKYPAFASIETGIMKEDIAKKNKRLEDILKFLSLSAGYGEEANLADLYTANPTITDIITKMINEKMLSMPQYQQIPSGAVDSSSYGGSGGSGDAGWGYGMGSGGWGQSGYGDSGYGVGFGGGDGGWGYM